MKKNRRNTGTNTKNSTAAGGNAPFTWLEAFQHACVGMMYPEALGIPPHGKEQPFFLVTLDKRSGYVGIRCLDGRVARRGIEAGDLLIGEVWFWLRVEPGWTETDRREFTRYVSATLARFLPRFDLAVEWGVVVDGVPGLGGLSGARPPICGFGKTSGRYEH